MKLQALSGLGVLLVVIPGLLIGVSYADQGTWAELNDPRWLLILLGLGLLLVSNLRYRLKGGRGKE